MLHRFFYIKFEGRAFFIPFIIIHLLWCSFIFRFEKSVQSINDLRPFWLLMITVINAEFTLNEQIDFTFFPSCFSLSSLSLSPSLCGPPETPRTGPLLNVRWHSASVESASRKCVLICVGGKSYFSLSSLASLCFWSLPLLFELSRFVVSHVIAKSPAHSTLLKNYRFCERLLLSLSSFETGPMCCPCQQIHFNTYSRSWRYISTKCVCVAGQLWGCHVTVRRE